MKVFTDTAQGDALEAKKTREDYLDDLKKYKIDYDQGDLAALKEMRDAIWWLADEAFSRDKAEAFDWHSKSAELGSAHSPWKVACLYNYGIGVPANKIESVKWARRAAENGLLDAQMGIAESYRRGEGVEMDSEAAAGWYRMAAERGLHEAQFELGFFISTGIAKPKPGENAWDWYEKAAYQEEARAQFSMGIAFEDGDAFPKDISVAYMWYSLGSANQKNTPLDNINHNPESARLNLSKKMSDQQILYAEKLSSEWKPKNNIAWSSQEIEELRSNNAD